MPGESHFAKLVRMYAGAPINRALKPVLTVESGSATLILQATPDLHHAAGGVHGSIYFKMLDDAAFFAANSLVDDALVLTASFSVEFFRPVADGELRAVGRVTKPGRNLIFAAAVLCNATGTELGRGSGVFSRSSLPLDATVGYR